LLYGSETGAIKAREARRITAVEVKYMRTAGYTWTDYKTNTQIAKELKITSIREKLLEYKRNWIQRIATWLILMSHFLITVLWDSVLQDRHLVGVFTATTNKNVFNSTRRGSDVIYDSPT
jgi:hypothetical protein